MTGGTLRALLPLLLAGCGLPQSDPIPAGWLVHDDLRAIHRLIMVQREQGLLRVPRLNTATPIAEAMRGTHINQELADHLARAWHRRWGYHIAKDVVGKPFSSLSPNRVLVVCDKRFHDGMKAIRLDGEVVFVP